jgi:tyrosyl-tRNA synthetase
VTRGTCSDLGFITPWAGSDAKPGRIERWRPYDKAMDEAANLPKLDLLDELRWRGMLHQTTHETALREHLATGRRRVYVGLDPTADSLTIGNLVTLMLLGHVQRCGHEAVVVAGGGTGLIGDPGGKSAERPLLPTETVEANIRSHMRIYDALLPGAIVLNNADWLTKLSFVEVLRDVGKHFSVNEMVKRDSVRTRLEADGISYTEFSYMLLQAFDFAHLHREFGVTIQMGGSDQWGNIVSGADLIRRTQGTEAYAITCPLLTKADGGKFGKSERGAVWLTADRTSAYAFHQFWLNTDDADVVRFLKTFTFLTQAEIAEIETQHVANPGVRLAQRALADDVTTRLHGADACVRANAAGKALFSGDVAALDEQTLGEVFADVPSSDQPRADLLPDGLEMVDLLVRTGLATSRRDARTHLDSGAVLLNGAKVDANYRLRTENLLLGRLALVRRGKKQWHVTRWA